MKARTPVPREPIRQLRRWLAETGTTQVALARKVGRSRERLSQILRSDPVTTVKRPGREFALDLEAITGIPADSWYPKSKFRRITPPPARGRSSTPRGPAAGTTPTEDHA